MEIVNLLDFLNKTKNLTTLEYASYDSELINLLDIMEEDEQFTQKIDLGLIFLNSKTLNEYTIVDGLARILSLSLLLHAICECYKKTSSQNESAIKTIRSKYLLDGNSTKLKLSSDVQQIYNKILFGEKLSSKEKETAMFKILHRFWTQIKTDKLKAANIFKMLNKVTVTLVDTNNVPKRDLYYKLNKDSKKINQILLIEDYLKNLGIKEHWENIRKIFNNSSFDLILFFKDFFITKFNFKEFSELRLYEIFVNYFETMLQYMPEDVLLQKLTRTAMLYNNLLYVNIKDEKIKKALIQIKMHNGEDTYAYLLNIYEDYIDNNITESTFLEILTTIDEYLRNRIKTPNDVSFNELIKYLNAFITCK